MSQLISSFQFGRDFLDGLEKLNIKVPEKVQRIVIDIDISHNNIPKIYYSCVAESAHAEVFNQVMRGESIDMAEDQKEIKLGE